MRKVGGGFGVALLVISFVPALRAQPSAVFQVSPVVVGVSGAGHSCNGGIERTAQALAFGASSVSDMIAFAYDLPLDRIERRPQWTYDDCYRVSATTEAPASLPEQKRMLQALLAERFELLAHRISYPSLVYVLSPGARVNLKETDQPDEVGLSEFRIKKVREGFRPQDTVHAAHASMTDLAAWLSRELDLPVIDKTGITGRFDIEITAVPVRGDGDGIILAVRNSLGLLLEVVHDGRAESLIIDHIERPQ